MPNNPKVPGLESFRGPIYHTARWPEQSVDFSGLRVGVIGTGSSGVQAIPLIAEAAAQIGRVSSARQNSGARAQPAAP